MAEETGSKVSRRNFLKKTAAGAAAVGILSATPSMLGATAIQRDGSGTEPRGPLVAYVRDVAQGEVVIFVGTREVVRRDSALVSRLLASAG